MSIEKKGHVLVTGATGGIGSHLCSRLVKDGYKLVLAARNISTLENQRNALCNEVDNADVIAFQMDFSNHKTHSTLEKELAARDIALEGLVIMPPQIPPTKGCLPGTEVWRNLLENSFIGPVNLIESCLLSLEKSGKAKVVIVSGISSVQVLSHYATSNVLRTSWLGQAKTMAAEFGPKGIHVNTLSLGGVMTPKYIERLQKKALEACRTLEEQMEVEVSNVPLKKYASLDDVASGIIGLLGPFADHITGNNIICDGGFTRAY